MIFCGKVLLKLQKRQDGFYELISYYESMPVPLEDVEGDTAIIELSFVEILISNMVGVNTISDEQFEDFAEIMEMKESQKSKAPELYGDDPGLIISDVETEIEG